MNSELDLAIRMIDMEGFSALILRRQGWGFTGWAKYDLECPYCGKKYAFLASLFTIETIPCPHCSGETRYTFIQEGADGASGFDGPTLRPAGVK